VPEAKTKLRTGTSTRGRSVFGCSFWFDDFVLLTMLNISDDVIFIFGSSETNRFEVGEKP